MELRIKKLQRHLRVAFSNRKLVLKVPFINKVIITQNRYAASGLLLLNLLAVVTVINIIAPKRNPQVLDIAEATFTMPGSGELQANFDDSGYDDGGGTTAVLSTEVKINTTDTWWGIDWDYYQQITLNNLSSDDLAAGTPVQIPVDTKDMYDNSKLQTLCQDLRIVHYDAGGPTFTEKTRSYHVSSGATNCSDSTTTIVTFPLHAAISASSSDSNYYLYYGNPEASDPGSGDNGYNIGSKNATLICPFSGSSTCLDGETPTTEAGAVRYSGATTALELKDNGWTSSTHVDIGAPAVLDNITSGPVTFEMWIYEKKYIHSPYSYLFGAGGGSSPKGAAAYMNAAALRLNFTVYKDGANAVALADGSSLVPINEWTHVALTYDHTGDQLPRIFINGTEATYSTQTAGSGNPNDDTGANWRVPGSVWNNTDMNGYIDEFRISNTVRYTENFTPQTTPFAKDENTMLLYHLDEGGNDPRNAAKAIDASGNNVHSTVVNPSYTTGLVGEDIAAGTSGGPDTGVYAGHQGIFIEEGTTNKIVNPSFEHSTYNNSWKNALADDLIAFWKLDEINGTRYDSVGTSCGGSGCELTDNNTVTQADGIIGSAAEFTAANTEYLSHTDHTDLQASDTFTISGWFYPTTIDSTRMLIAKGSGFTGATIEYRIFQDTTNLWFQVGDGTSIILLVVAGIVQNDWNHFVAWVDVPNTTTGLILNNGTPDTDTISSSPPTTAADFRIGRDLASGENYFEGRIDALGFWNRVLSSDERAALYNSGNATEYPFNEALAATESTDPKYAFFGDTSAQLQATATSDFVTELNPGNTNTHTLTAYVRNWTSTNEGKPVNDTIAQIVWEGAAKASGDGVTYTDMGSGWWRLKYTAATTAADNLYGIRILAEKGAFVDGFQLEEKIYQTTFCDGSLGTGYSWNGTENDSTSTRQNVSLQYDTANITSEEGSTSIWLKPNWNSDFLTANQQLRLFLLFKDGNNYLLLEYLTNTHTFRLTRRVASTSYSATIAAQVFSKDDLIHLVATWDTVSGTKLYVNNGTPASNANVSHFGTGATFSIGYTYYINSTLSDFRVYDSALTADEVADLYYTGLTAHGATAESAGKYYATGTYTTPILDLGATADWSTGDDITFTETLNGGTATYQTATSSNGTDWEAWQDLSGAEIQSTPARYVKIKASLASSGDQSATPILSGLNINYIPDNTPPINPTTLITSPGDPANWYNDSTPTFTWPRAEQAGGATDPGEGASGVSKYHVYFGTDDTAIPYSTVTNKWEVDDPDSGEVEFTLPTPLESADTYYLRIQAEDNAGNYPGNNPEDTWAAFTYKFEETDPTKPLYISVNPSGYTNVNSYKFTWPAGTDGDSGVYGYCYKAGSGAETCETKEALEDGANYSKTLNDVAYQQGENIFYVRTKDNAENYSDYTQATFYYNSTAPSEPLNVTAHATTGCSGGDDNCWYFTWDEPLDYTEEITTYYYSVNETPTEESPTVEGDTTQTPTFSAGTRQGENTFYVVAEDVVSVNFGVTGGTTFNVDTTAPSIPQDLLIADASNRDTDDWALTVKWSEPSSVGSGIDHYNVYRSTNSTDYSKAGEATSTIYSETGLSNSTTYYYKVSASDNAEAESGLSGAFSAKPTGKYTSPPLFGGTPTTNTTAHTATIQWTTDRMSESYVEYGHTEDYELGRVGDSTQTTAHKIVVRGLVAETLFHYRVQSLDDGAVRSYTADQAYSSDYTFTTLKAPDITEVSVTDITLSSATLSWKTTTISTSEVHYGTTMDYGLVETEESSSLTTNHTIRLGGLNSGTTYHLKIVGRDADDVEIYSDNYSFSTIAYPALSNIRVEKGDVDGEYGMFVSWDSNVRTSSIATYYPADDTADKTDEVKAALSTNHEIFIAGLKDSTTYQLQASGRDSFGNLATSEIIEFTTDIDTRPPIISNLTVETATQGTGKDAKAQIIVSWETNEPATSQVDYGIGVGGENYSGKTPEVAALNKTHVVVISDLETGTPYNVKAVSKDAAGNITESVNYTIVTSLPQESAFDLILGTLRQNFSWLIEF